MLFLLGRHNQNEASTTRPLKSVKTKKRSQKTLMQGGKKQRPSQEMGSAASKDLPKLGDSLGLKQEFDDWLDRQGENRIHRSDEDWITTFLDDNSESLEQSKKTEHGQLPSEREQLCTLGYTDDKAEEISTWFQSLGEDYRDHRSLKDWAKTYTTDELQCCGRRALFPFRGEEKSTWLPLDIPLKGTSPMSSKTYETKYINLVNGQDESYKTFPQDGEKYPPRSDDDHLYLYHATTHKHARSILDGIKLQSTRWNDFSNPQRPGFYMSTDFNDAWDWAKRRSHGNVRPAILVFKLRKDNLGGNCNILHLNHLDGFEEFRDTQGVLDPPMTTMEIWQEVLKLCRAGVKIRVDMDKVYRESDAVHGYMCHNGQFHGNNEQPRLHIPPKDQYCFLSATMCDNIIWPNINGILFFAEI